ncbi:MAG TPA: alpha-amylase family glycosyl hydrolase [Gaiellaceae bacterium]|nr:alpha-amylase family glycosyl hydrolase [Gaiellaceae bacterium]
MSRFVRAAGVVIALVAATSASAATDLVFQKHKVSAPPPPTGALLEALAQPPRRSSIASQRIYFVMTDRYANGDTANDRGGRTGPRSVTGYDPADTGWFHGGDLRGLTGGCTSGTGLARIKALGFTAVWVTPPFGQKTVQGSSAAYHGYWIRDFASVDPHLGTNADFADFVACAHRLGLKVYLDVVVNHTADVILPSGTGYSSAPYRDCRGKAFNPARYAGGRTFPCLKVGNFPRVPVVLAEDRHAKSPAWLNDARRYHNRGDIDFGSCSETCFEQGDFFGLDDLFTEQPVVVNGLARVYGDWIRRTKVDGFRIDTARHVDRAFFKVWTPKILATARAAGVPEFELFGEVFNSDAIELSSFVRERRLPNVLDFPFQDAATRYAAGAASAKGIVARLDDDDYFQGPSGVAHTPPTFLGNHDMGRAARMIKDRSGGTSGAELLRRVQLAYSLMYLLRGAPVVYYGDEVGIVGSGGDKEARQDLFPTQVAGWRTGERVGSAPIGAGSSLEIASHPIADELKVLGALRDAHPALSSGASIVRLAARGVLAVSRIDAAAKREYVAAFNAGTTTERVVVPTSTPSADWTGLIGVDSRSNDTGGLVVSIPPTGTLLLRANADLPVARPAVPKLEVAADDLTELVRVTTTPNAKTVSVAFAVRRASGSWRRLAVDDSPPYRAFLDPKAYRRGETVHLVAIARALDGTTAVSAVVPAILRR